MNKETPFYIFLLGVFLLLISPALLSHGMFMDGMMYAAISHNMSEGLGTFWTPYFTASYGTEFYGHPPLAFGILSSCYKIFGDAFFIEKLYSLATWLLVAVGMVRIWKFFKLKNAWFPLLLLMTMTRVYWAATNNMLENTLAVFVIFSVYFFLKSTERKFIFLLLSGVFAALGFLTKGPVALFIWGFPFFYQLIYMRKPFSKALLSSVALMAITVAALALVYSSSSAAMNNLKNYFDLQIVNSLAHVETVESRWFIVIYLLGEISFPLILTSLSILVWKIKKINNLRNETTTRLSLAFILAALSGVVPMMISLKQSGFYTLPTFPLFALAFAFFLYPKFEQLLQKFNAGTGIKNIFGVIAWSTLFAAVVVNSLYFNTTYRDEEKLDDMHQSIKYMEPDDKVGLNHELAMDWSLIAYFQRYYGLCLEHDPEYANAYQLSDSTGLTDLASRNFVQISRNTKTYHLYRRK